MIGHKSLLEALLAVQEAAPAFKKTGRNPAFKSRENPDGSRYTTLEEVTDATRPLLAEHGLIWSTFPLTGMALRYTLTHVPTGESLSAEMPLVLEKATMQGLGSAITYGRRQALQAVLNLVADEDDDGNAASARAPQNAAQQATRQTTLPVAEAPRPTEAAVSAKQRGLIFSRAGEAGISPSALANMILTVMGQDEREFADEDAANRFINAGLQRFPQVRVNTLLKSIETVRMP